MQHGGCQSKAFVLRPALGIAVRHRASIPLTVRDGRQTGPLTKVNRCLAEGRARPRDLHVVE